MKTYIVATMSTADLRRIASKFKASSKELESALANAINRVARDGRGAIRKGVRAYVNLPMARVNGAIEIKQKAKPQNLEATITIDRRAKGQDQRPTLMSFGGKPSKPHYEQKRAANRRAKGMGAGKSPPFTYQILKGGSRVVSPNAFVARATRRFNFQSRKIEDLQAGTGNVQAFRRVGKKRFKLAVPKGPSIAAIWQNESNGIAKNVMSELKQKLPAEIMRESKRIYSAKWSEAKR